MNRSEAGAPDASRASSPGDPASTDPAASAAAAPDVASAKQVPVEDASAPHAPIGPIATSIAAPLMIGVTGHRDLVRAETPVIEATVERFLRDLRTRYPDLPLQIITPLAEGADRLVGRIARRLGIPLLVPLPMPQDLYEQDFESPESLAEFRSLMADHEHFALPLVTPESGAEIVAHGEARNLQYAQLGTYVAAHSHILLAIWDGEASDALGGTAQVVQFHQYDVMRGFTSDDRMARLHFTADESDLVYHVRCSRRSGAPNPQAVSAVWLTSNQVAPTSETLPDDYAQIFRHMEEFAEDTVDHADSIQTEAWPLFEAKDAEHIRPGALRIDRIFRAADWLAIHYQKRVHIALRLIYGFAAAAGVCFIAYADLEDQDHMIYPYLAFLLASVLLAWFVGRGDWHRRYLEYRALAEGLRVQFYWAVAGVRQPSTTKFTHDTYLRSQDIELGWIRNVMRVTGTRAELAGDPVPPKALEYVLAEWVGDERRGQAAYFRRKSAERAETHQITQWLGRGAFVAGGVSALVLAVMQDDLDGSLRNVLIALMGLLPLLAVIRETYAQKKADQELVRQYHFMHGIFLSASRLLQQTEDINERHHILRSLGSAALEENAEWLLRLRDRPLESAGTPT
jgi:hypothetical protein